MKNAADQTRTTALLPTRRKLLGAAALGVMVPLSRPGMAQGSWRPTRPVRVVVPFPPGGATDMLARLISQKASDRLGQTMVIENRPGGSGVVATMNLLNSPPDGHSIMMATVDTHTVLPAARKSLPYRVQDFVPITGVANVVFACVARPGLDVTNLAELVAKAKAANPPLTYASYGVASASHVAGEMFKAATGTEMLHVPYQGAGPGVMAITADEVDMMMVPVAVAQPQRARLRMLGVASSQRFDMVPEVPTLAEQGVPLNAHAWIGLLAAPRTPRGIAESINAAVSEVISTPEFQEALRTNGFSYQGYGPERFAAYLKDEAERWGAAVRAASITVEG